MLNARKLGELYVFVYARLLQDVPELGVFSLPDDWLDSFEGVEGVELIF